MMPAPTVARATPAPTAATPPSSSPPRKNSAARTPSEIPKPTAATPPSTYQLFRRLATARPISETPATISQVPNSGAWMSSAAIPAPISEAPRQMPAIPVSVLRASGKTMPALMAATPAPIAIHTPMAIPVARTPTSLASSRASKSNSEFWIIRTAAPPLMSERLRPTPATPSSLPRATRKTTPAPIATAPAAKSQTACGGKSTIRATTPPLMSERPRPTPATPSSLPRATRKTTPAPIATAPAAMTEIPTLTPASPARLPSASEKTPAPMSTSPNPMLATPISLLRTSGKAMPAPAAAITPAAMSQAGRPEFFPINDWKTIPPPISETPKPTPATPSSVSRRSKIAIPAPTMDIPAPTPATAAPISESNVFPRSIRAITISGSPSCCRKPIASPHTATPMPTVAIPPSARAARYRSNGITVAAIANRAAPSTAYPDQEKGTNAAITVHAPARISATRDKTTTRGASSGNRRSRAAPSRMPPAAALMATPR